ncbi:Glu-tRNA(Gln) amidotransferase GatDE subunit E [Candidatus Woesearchaeota archaeon CG_4_10_14_0_2_um_filter_33_13]|nr:MAG: Glu-tRNA(Gln) amidotransferase GatDE subunit E [Candidatus Woesearchaeota archaeon CG_4_10_14_0_2_um_filter_33_13]
MNYTEIGLKCGIEIHQQLEGKKLFCNCPTKLRDDEPHFTIKRKLRAVAGEHGEIDVAAKQEQLKDKTFLYQGYFDSTCLVETDSEPPHEISSEALYTALQFCKMVKARVSPIVQVMRKTVVDGSNTSGFQRTALLSRGGELDTSEGKVRIENISLEEDSCKNISESQNEKVYRLDRLGIPLIEIGTAPDIKTPEQCQETAKKIGLLLRSLPGVKRGLGTIRQDVNVSVREGERIEIKGAQDLKMIPTLVELEIKRQLELVKISKELNGKKLNPIQIHDLTKLLNESTSKIIKNTTDKNGKILAIKLNDFAGLVGRELQPNYRVGSEFSGRAKAAAGVGGIFHSDELPNYGITAEEVALISKELKCKEKDAFILVADKEVKAQVALNAVHHRATELFYGVIREVRKANPDGTTSFMRLISGADRMYPETDVPLIRPDLSIVKVPETLEEKIKRYQKSLKLSADLANFIAKSDKMVLFEELVKKHPKIKTAFIAETLISTTLDIKRKYELDPEKLTEDNFRQLFQYLDEEKIHKDIIIDVMIDMIKGKFDLKNYATISTEELHAKIKEVVEKNKGASQGALMGLCMKALAGKASGQFIAEELKRILEK